MYNTISDQFPPETTTAMMMQTIPEKNPMRRNLVLMSVSIPLPNFMANIGISLTRSAERIIATTGKKNQVPQSELIHDSGLRST